MADALGLGSLRFEARKPHHLAPLLGFRGDQASEVGGRARQNRAAEFGKPRLDQRIGQRGVDFPVKLSTMPAGVPLGVPSPYHALAS